VDQSLSEKAAETLARALEASSLHERGMLVEEALGLHRRAVEAHDAVQVGDAPISSPG